MRIRSQTTSALVVAMSIVIAACGKGRSNPELNPPVSVDTTATENPRASGGNAIVQVDETTATCRLVSPSCPARIGVNGIPFSTGITNASSCFRRLASHANQCEAFAGTRVCATYTSETGDTQIKCESAAFRLVGTWKLSAPGVVAPYYDGNTYTFSRDGTFTNSSIPGRGTFQYEMNDDRLSLHLQYTPPNVNYYAKPREIQLELDANGKLRFPGLCAGGHASILPDCGVGVYQRIQ